MTEGAAAKKPLVRVDELAKHFPVRGLSPFSQTRGWVRAVDGISFTIHRGETLGLVGESGCGKTTTSKLVLLLEKPTAGAIYFDERNIHELRGEERMQYRSVVQAVFQDPWSSLSPRMRVKDIISEPIHNAKISPQAKKERVEHLLTEVGLEPAVGNNFPHEFSGGQRQRIAVARALAPGSQLIVLDEPISALDVSIRAQLMNLLRDLQEQHGISYLLIAHDLATVRHLSDQVAVMYLGRIMERGPAADVVNKPLHPYARALISATMVAQPGERQTRIILRGEVPSPLNPPSGCRFHPRCPLREQLGQPLQCQEEEPALRELLPGHVVRCHFAEENLRTSARTEVVSAQALS